MSDDSRQRKVCSNCESLTIMKSRKYHGFYRCKACGATFQVAKLKDVKTHNKIPGCLKSIMEQKQKESILNGEIND